MSDKQARPEVTDPDNQNTFEKWPPLAELGRDPTPDFPVFALPQTLRKFVLETAEETQTPPELAAMLCLATCAACLAKVIEVEGFPGWIEPINLYTVVILGPGNRKSAVFKLVTAPIRKVETQLREDAQETVAIAKSHRRQDEKRLAKLEKVAAEASDPSKRNQAREEAIELAQHLASDPEPELPTLLVDNITSEKLETVLQANNERVAMMSAEGGIFELMQGKYSKNGGPDFDTYLKAHSGDASSTDRIGRSSVRLESPALTTGLTIQPQVLKSISGNHDMFGRGLLARFLYALPESLIGRRSIASPPVSEPTKLAYEQLIEGLSSCGDLLNDKPHALKFTPEALVALKDYCEWVERELGYGSLQSMKEWGGKLAGATLRIAANLHCVQHLDDGKMLDPIDESTLADAITIAKSLIPHAKASFSLLNNQLNQLYEDVEVIDCWLRREFASKETFTRRQLHRSHQRRFNNQAHRLDDALQMLVDSNYIKLLPDENEGGTEVYAISPLLKGNTPQSEDNGDNQAEQKPVSSRLSPLSTVKVESKNGFDTVTF